VSPTIDPDHTEAIPTRALIPTKAICYVYNHRYTNNTGLEAPFRATALLVVPEVINFVVATLVAILFLEDGKFTHIPRTVGMA